MVAPTMAVLVVSWRKEGRAVQASMRAAESTDAPKTGAITWLRKMP